MIGVLVESFRLDPVTCIRCRPGSCQVLIEFVLPCGAGLLRLRTGAITSRLGFKMRALSLVLGQVIGVRQVVISDCRADQNWKERPMIY